MSIRGTRTLPALAVVATALFGLSPPAQAVFLITLSDRTVPKKAAARTGQPGLTDSIGKPGDLRNTSHGGETGNALAALTPAADSSGNGSSGGGGSGRGGSGGGGSGGGASKSNSSGNDPAGKGSGTGSAGINGLEAFPKPDHPSAEAVPQSLVFKTNFSDNLDPSDCICPPSSGQQSGDHPVTATPAPAGIVLALTGLPILGLVLVRRKRQSRA